MWELISSSITTPVYWLLYSAGLWALFKKFGYKHRWKAFIPGIRDQAFGEIVGLPRDGWICCFLDAANFLAYTYLQTIDTDTRVGTGVLLLILQIVFTLCMFALRLRLFGRLRRILDISKWWIVLWILSRSLTMFILGFFRKFQPVKKEEAEVDEEWKAGTTPAALQTGGQFQPSDSGLSVNIRERVVKDRKKTRYLLKDISLNIPNGSLVLLLGGSGSGKTTFVNAVTGYEKANADVLLNGKNVYSQYDELKYRIGFVPQQNLIRMSDTVIATIEDAARLRLPADTPLETFWERVDSVMDLLGLTAGQDGLVGKKSGGQLRRISIAMELVSDPDLFILDEPDSGLDGVIAREIFTKLRKIADTGKIVIVITHTPDRVVDLFDRVIVLARDSGRVGRLAFTGTPDEARAFFGRDTMEGVVMCINGKAEGGEGLADEMIGRFAEMTGRTAQSEEAAG